MSTQSARDAIDLVGKTVRPARGTERWAFSKGRPEIGKVIDVHIPDLEHPYVVVQYDRDIDYHYAFECEVLTH